jgi:ribosome-associated protein
VQSKKEGALALARSLADHKGGDVVLLDLGPCKAWTDFFVLATAMSSTHLRGLALAADEWAHQNGLSIRNSPKISDDEAWVLLDLGDIVVHLMTKDARAFYELEKLWFQAEASGVEPSGPDPSKA